jgi:hypothetical protein
MSQRTSISRIGMLQKQTKFGDKRENPLNMNIPKG